MALWYLFDFIIKKIGRSNITLKHLLLEATDKRLDKKEVLFNCFNES